MGHFMSGRAGANTVEHSIVHNNLTSELWVITRAFISARVRFMGKSPYGMGCGLLSQIRPKTEMQPIFLVCLTFCHVCSIIHHNVK
jgi:hypothetical protein